MARSSPGQPTKKYQDALREEIAPYVRPIKRKREKLTDDRDAGDELKDHELRTKIIAMRTRDGFSPDIIAVKLGISKKTVLKYIDWALRRFNEKTHTQEQPLGSTLISSDILTKHTKKLKKKKKTLTLPPARYEDRKFQREVFYLRRSSIPISEIADLQDATEIEVERAIALYVQRLNESETNDIEIARRTQVEQIDTAIRALLPYSTGVGEDSTPHKLDFSAIDRLVKLMEAKAKLLGLNVPQRIDIRTRLEVIAEEGEYDLDDLLSIYQEVVKEIPALTAGARSRT
jgi:hypothetical protein